MRLSTLRLVSWIEGASLLLLLFVAMPLKYLADLPMAVQIVGSVHGLLWLVFIGALLSSWGRGKLSIEGFVYGGVTSVIPGGPLIFDRHLERAEADPEAENPPQHS